MKHDVQVESQRKLKEILVKRHGREEDDLLYHDMRDLLFEVIQNAYKAGTEFYKETSGIKIGLEKMTKSRKFKGKFANIKDLDANRSEGKWYRAHDSIYSGSGLDALIATCHNPGFAFADARFLTALVDIWPMIQEILEEDKN